MELIRKNREVWDPFDLISDLQTDLNRVFDRNLTQNRSWAKSFHPDIEVSDEGDHFKLTADLPGLQKEDFNLAVEGNRITLTGERKSEKEKKEKHYHYSERIYGSFTRTLEFPAEVAADRVKATYKNGVLEVLLPKSENAKPKSIQVEVK